MSSENDKAIQSSEPDKPEITFVISGDPGKAASITIQNAPEQPTETEQIEELDVESRKQFEELILSDFRSSVPSLVPQTKKSQTEVPQTASQTCWFCGQRPAHAEYASNVPLCKLTDVDVKISGGAVYTKETTIKWQETHVSIPRCSKCRETSRKAYDAISARMTLSFIFFMLLSCIGLAITAMKHINSWGNPLMIFTWVALLIGIALPGAILLFAFVQYHHLIKKFTSYPAIQDLRSDGWALRETLEPKKKSRPYLWFLAW